MLDALREDLKALANPKKARFLQGFFKTGKGEYGEGDVFLGLTVPESRSIAKKYKTLTLAEIEKLLSSKIHEERQIALMILVMQFEKGNKEEKKTIYDFYFLHTASINNWDLVDGSASYIVGEYLFWSEGYHFKSKLPLARDSSALSQIETLYTLAHSRNLWERRIAILATFAFVKHAKYQLTCTIADILMPDTHDLIHKAVGWMLREVGKRCSKKVLETFLQTRYKKMPRTMLRYAIEHFPKEGRKAYLEGKI